MGSDKYIVIIEYKYTLQIQNKSMSIVFNDIFIAIDFMALQAAYFNRYIYDIKLFKIKVI